MSCERYAPSIADHACGAEMTSDLAHHLAGCTQCAALLEAQQQSIASLDAEIANALDVPVSNTFIRDVRARVEHDERRSAWWLSWGIVPVAAALLVAVWLRPVAIETPRLPVAPPPNWQVSRTATIVPDATPTFVETLAAPRQIARALPRAEVIVPPDGGRAISQYLQLVRHGVLDTSTLAAPSNRVGEDLVVTPLTMEPIVLSGVEISPKPTSGGPGSGPRGD
jgi:anti-sigma factor RsiW